VKSFYQRLGILTGTTTIFLASFSPMQAADRSLSKIELRSSKNGGIDLILKDRNNNFIDLSNQKQNFSGNKSILKSSQELKKKKVRANILAQATNEDKTSVPPQTQANSTTTPNVLVPNPTITINGQPVANNANPPQTSDTPQFIPRAIAPPVGDMAISNINAMPDKVDLGSLIVVPRLVLKDAPIREVLSILARSAGLNIVYTDKDGGSENQPTISLDLENEPIQEVFNSVLMISNYQANRRGNTIYVGTKLPDAARNLITRSFRLNQIPVADAAAFLASHGAEVQIYIPATITKKTEVVGGVTSASEVYNAPQFQALTPERTSSIAPLLLQGLSVSTDQRLNSLTLIGEPNKVQIAASFLTQLDARRRQVAINVKVVDVNLLGRDTYNSSFSFGSGDAFFIQDNGAFVFNYGGTNPANSSGIITGSPFDLLPTKFLTTLKAQITSGNAKILTDPTLVVQEGQTAGVDLSQEVVGNIKTTTETTNNVTTKTVTAEIKKAGLTLNINLEKIDDNGFVTLSVDPTVTSIGANQDLSVDGNTNSIALLNVRQVKSGKIRLRDSQTLILSGIIQESERTTVSKIPILGDIPLLGALFRKTENTNQRNEVIVLLTPQIINDSQTSGWGYNYNPSPDAQKLLQQQGFSVPPK
jgi:type IV pilus assembly protein PilQ